MNQNSDAPAQAPSPAPPQGIAGPLAAQAQESTVEAAAVRPIEAATSPWLRAAPKPPGKMTYVVLGAAALISVAAGVWYFSKSKGKEEVQQRQQTETVEPALRPSPLSTTATQSPTITVPFVGCEDLGMDGITPAPDGTEKVLKIDNRGAAERLSYYKSAASPGVLAPRGWNCHGRSDTSGSYLTITPPNQDAANGTTTGPMVVVSRVSGATSGRFTIAKVITRIFPAHEAFARNVISEGLMPASDFPFGPYPKDKITVQNDSMVEYETPPHSKGLGTNAGLTADDYPIQGVAILEGQYPDLVLLGVRLPPDPGDLGSNIIQQKEREDSPNL